MNSLSQINPGGMGHHGGYGAMSSSAAGVNSYESLNAGLTIQTREGDVVTLSASRFSELDAHEYTSQGEFAGSKGSMSAAYHQREITLSSGEQFTFTVNGDLSEEELEDIESIVSGVDGIIGEMAEGDMEDALSKALSMGSYDSISKYEAEITVERAQAAYAENRSSAYGRGRHGRRPDRVPELAHGMAATPYDMGSSFMNRVAGLLDEQKEEAVAWARQPLSQLFTHHLEALAPPEAEEGSDEMDAGDVPAETVLTAAPEEGIEEYVEDDIDATEYAVGDAMDDDAAEAADGDADDDVQVAAAQVTATQVADTDDAPKLFEPRDQSLYKMLEDAAQRVDELINSMMKDFFGNTLDRMV